MVSKFFLIVSFFLISLRGAFGQVHFVNGKRCADYVDISFNQQVIVLGDSIKYARLENIKPQYAKLLEILAKFDSLVIEKKIPWAKWGDTLRTNWRGDLVRVPDMSQHFTLHFAKPVLEKEIFKLLRKLPEVSSVTGPGYIQFQTDPGKP